jgi:integrase/recombinase XerD
LAWKPKRFYHHRLQCLVLVLADTGARLGEALGLKWSEVDFDSLLVLLHGKGGKDRRVPFSAELRKFLWRFNCASMAHNRESLVFATRDGNRLGNRVVLRDVKLLCDRLGIRCPARSLHAFRHTMAVNYVRSGGNVFYLQRILGHASLVMTRKYVALDTEDLSAVHERRSLLGRRSL